jgi:hypothetical protein
LLFLQVLEKLDARDSAANRSEKSRDSWPFGPALFKTDPDARIRLDAIRSALLRHGIG